MDRWTSFTIHNYLSTFFIKKLLNIDIKKAQEWQQSRRYDSTLMVPQVSSEVHWCATGIQAQLSLIERLIDSSVLLHHFLFSPSTHVHLVPCFWHPRLFDHSACLYCTALQRTTEDYSERRERKGKGRMERKHSISLFLSLWHLALWEYSSLKGIWELNTEIACVQESGRPWQSLSRWLLKVLL